MIFLYFLNLEAQNFKKFDVLTSSISHSSFIFKTIILKTNKHKAYYVFQYKSIEKIEIISLKSFPFSSANEVSQIFGSFTLVHR